MAREPTFLDEMVQQRRLGYLDEQTLLRTLNRQRMLAGLEPAQSLDQAIGGGVGPVRQTEVAPLQVNPLMPGRSGPGAVEYVPPQDNSLGQAVSAMFGGDGGGIQKMMERLRAAQTPPAPPPAQSGAKLPQMVTRGRTLTEPQAPAPPTAPGATPTPTAPGAAPTMAPGRDFGRVNPQFMQAATEWSRVYGGKGGPYSVTFTSGHRAGSAGEHGRGNAIDMQLVDKQTGKPLPNYQVKDPAVVRAYQDYANGFKQYLDANYPDLAKDVRWGGYFSGGKGTYGALDLMHFDLGGPRHGMLGGSWEGGFTPQHAATWGLQAGGGLAGRPPMAPGTPAPAAATPPAATPSAAAGGLSPELIRHTMFWESFRPRAYNDGKQWSVGYGTRASSPNEVIDEPTARARLVAELTKAQGAVDKILPPNAPPNVRDALTSLTLNVGPGWTTEPGNKLASVVVAGDYASAATLIKAYNKADGRMLPGLVARRNAEADMMMQAPKQPAPPAAQPAPQAAPQSDNPPPRTMTTGPQQQLTPEALRAWGQTQLAPGMVERGNLDLNNRPVVKNPDGSISTVRSVGVNVDGKEVLLPTVSPDGKIMTTDEAVDLYRKTGQHLGVFDSPKTSTDYAEQLHLDQEKQYAPAPQSGQPISMTPGIGQAAIKATQGETPQASAPGAATPPPQPVTPPVPAQTEAPARLAQQSPQQPPLVLPQPAPQANWEPSSPQPMQASWEAPSPQQQQQQMQPFGMGNLSPIPWDWMSGWGWGSPGTWGGGWEAPSWGTAGFDMPSWGATSWDTGGQGGGFSFGGGGWGGW